jgi:hypothetical protein
MDNLTPYLILRSFLGLIWWIIVLIITWRIYRLIRKAKVTRQQAIRFHLIVGMWSWVIAGMLMVFVANGVQFLNWPASSHLDEFGTSTELQKNPSWSRLSFTSRALTKTYVWFVPSAVREGHVSTETDNENNDGRDRVMTNAWGIFVFGACYFMGAFLLHLGMYLPPKATLGIPIVDDDPVKPKEEGGA